MVYAAEKALRELADKVPDDVKSDVEAKVQAVRDALAGSDASLIQQRTEELGTAVQQIGASAYEQPTAAPGPEEPAAEQQAAADDDSEPPPEEDVVEGEFEEA